MESSTDRTEASDVQESAGRSRAEPAPSFAAAPRVNRPARPAPIRSQVPEGPSPAVRAQRAAAARRRLTLTVILLIASVGSWVGASLTALSIIAPIIATTLLATVLVLGRRAVVSAQRGDQARAARFGQNTSGAAEAPARRTGRKRATSSVVGRAVHGNQTRTEMIATVPEATGSEEAPAADESSESSAQETSSGAEAAEEELAEKTVESEEASSSRGAKEQGGELTGFALPRSTYVTKPAAPRRELAPLTPEDVTSPANASAKAQAARSAEEAEQGLDEELEVAPEGLSVDLNEVLARRRAAGA